MLPKVLPHLPIRLQAAVLAALLVLPGTTIAQVLYVAGIIDKVAAYDAKTGQPLAGFVPIKGDSYVVALRDNLLYVANKTGIGTYDATTGAPVNAGFISGLKFPGDVSGLAFHGNTLFVANVMGGDVCAYDATTGALVNENFLPDVERPFSLAVAGDVLYVSETRAYFSNGTNQGTDVGSVHAYHAATGKPLEAFRVINTKNPRGLLVVNNILYVASTPRNSIASVGKDPLTVAPNVIGTYHTETGAPINPMFAPMGDNTPRGMAVLGHTFFFANYSKGSVGTCDAATGKLIDPNFAKGVNNATGLALAAPALAP